MEVILTEDIRAVGKAGEVIKVAEGYGRNYLLPQKKGVLATPANLKRLETDRKGLEARREKLKIEAEGVAAKLREIKVVLDREAGEEDKLFGSVTPRHIEQSLALQGFTIDHRNIQLKEAVRTTGTFTADLHLHGDVVVPLTIEIRKK